MLLEVGGQIIDFSIIQALYNVFKLFVSTHRYNTLIICIQLAMQHRISHVKINNMPLYRIFRCIHHICSRYTKHLQYTYIIYPGLPRNLKKTFPWYYMHSDSCSIFKFTTTLLYVQDKLFVDYLIIINNSEVMYDKSYNQ